MAISALGSSTLTAITSNPSRSPGTETAQKLLAAMDADQSGAVSKDEFAAFGERMKAPVGRPPSATATEGQVRRVTSLSASDDELFATTDSNADQSLSVDELASMLAQGEVRDKATHGLEDKTVPSGGTAGPGGPPAGSGPHGSGKGAAPGAKSSSGSEDSANSASTSDPADTNHDGVVSAAEQLIYDITHPSASTSVGSSSSAVNALQGSR